MKRVGWTVAHPSLLESGSYAVFILTWRVGHLLREHCGCPTLLAKREGGQFETMSCVIAVRTPPSGSTRGLGVEQLLSLCDGSRGSGGDRIRMDGAASGANGFAADVRPNRSTLSLLREG